jgi:hypothetical protein
MGVNLQDPSLIASSKAQIPVLIKALNIALEPLGIKAECPGKHIPRTSMEGGLHHVAAPPGSINEHYHYWLLVEFSGKLSHRRDLHLDLISLRRPDPRCKAYHEARLKDHPELAGTYFLEKNGAAFEADDPHDHSSFWYYEQHPACVVQFLTNLIAALP